MRMIKYLKLVSRLIFSCIRILLEKVCLEFQSIQKLPGASLREHELSENYPKVLHKR